jgi:prophage maintenance system killer protein
MLAYYGGQHDIIVLAAVLGSGISQVRAFLDGNERTAYVSMRLFLDRNGYRLVTDPIKVAKHLEAIPEAPDRDAATEAFASWLREKTAPRTP